MIDLKRALTESTVKDIVPREVDKIIVQLVESLPPAEVTQWCAPGYIGGNLSEAIPRKGRHQMVTESVETLRRASTTREWKKIESDLHGDMESPSEMAGRLAEAGSVVA